MAKILRYLLGLSIVLCLFAYTYTSDLASEDDNQFTDVKASPPDVFTLDESREDEATNDIEAFIEKIEHFAAQAEKTIKEGILPIEYTNKIHSNMEERVEELVDLLNDSTHVYKFLNAKGIERIVLPNIGIPYPPLKRQFLLLIKNLFDVSPITTNAVIPIGVVDKILDIFEYDNLALKAHALDILNIWLPENPQIQTRVMKMKGLEPFYRQIPKLDAESIRQLLELFNKVVVEHMKARKKDVQRTKNDHNRFVLYQRIGLIERLSTPIACNGLLHILETTWSFNTKEKDVSQPIVEAIKNVHPLCVNFFKANPKRTTLFHDLLKYIEEPSRQTELEKLGLNITETRLILIDYSDIFKDVFVKDEF